MSSSLTLMAMLVAGGTIASALVCHQGWHASTNFKTCYKFVPNGKTWGDAQKDCQVQGGNLAVIDSLAKAEDIAKIRRDTGNEDPEKWLGAKRGAPPSSPYYWITGEHLDSALWASGEPNYHASAETCAYTYKDAAKFFDAPCSNQNGYTCEKSCPEGWYDSKFGTCYKFVSARTSWQNAKVACEKMGGFLAVVDTFCEAEAFAELRRVTGYVNGHYWVGSMQNPTSSSPFYWINGDRMFKSLWAAGEPNYHVPGDKACAYTYQDVTQFFDAPCGNRNEYACEKYQ